MAKREDYVDLVLDLRLIKTYKESTFQLADRVKSMLPLSLSVHSSHEIIWRT